MRSTITLPHDKSAPRVARTWMRQQINGLGLSESTFNNIMLALSELVTNVIAHTDSTATVVLRTDEAEVCVEVNDSSSEPAQIRPLGSEAAGGFGLRLVEQVSRRWGATCRRDGSKVVWFTVAVA
ncbi:MAG: anti-sigma regulatory factor [Ilumatobacteraceae bacterium]|nr:anti-sigma regulatory factor [Ilumatobacteraceae bacterium]